jgi:hypothetical protein
MPIVAKNTERDKELWRRWKAGERISVMARELALSQTRVHAIVHQVERLTQDASERGIVTRKVATLDEAKAEFERIWIASGGRGGFLRA